MARDYLPVPSGNLLTSYQEPDGGLYGVMGSRSASPTPVRRHHPPPSGFLRPHQATQGLRQQRGRLELENPLPYLLSLRNHDNKRLQKARQSLANEITPDIEHKFKAIFQRHSRLFGEAKEKLKTHGKSGSGRPSSRVRRRADKPIVTNKETPVHDAAPSDATRRRSPFAVARRKFPSAAAARRRYPSATAAARRRYPSATAAARRRSPSVPEARRRTESAVARSRWFSRIRAKPSHQNKHLTALVDSQYLSKELPPIKQVSPFEVSDIGFVAPLNLSVVSNDPSSKNPTSSRDLLRLESSSSGFIPKVLSDKYPLDGNLPTLIPVGKSLGRNSSSESVSSLNQFPKPLLPSNPRRPKFPPRNLPFSASHSTFFSRNPLPSPGGKSRRVKPPIIPPRRKSPIPDPVDNPSSRKSPRPKPDNISTAYKSSIPVLSIKSPRQNPPSPPGPTASSGPPSPPGPTASGGPPSPPGPAASGGPSVRKSNSRPSFPSKSPSSASPPARSSSSFSPPARFPSPASPPARSPSPASPPARSPSPASPPARSPSPASPPARSPSPASPPARSPSPASPPARSPSPASPPARSPSPASPPATSPQAGTPVVQSGSIPGSGGNPSGGPKKVPPLRIKPTLQLPSFNIPLGQQGGALPSQTPLVAPFNPFMTLFLPGAGGGAPYHLPLQFPILNFPTSLGSQQPFLGLL